MNHDDRDEYFYNLTIVKEKNGMIDAVFHHILAPPPHYTAALQHPGTLIPMRQEVLEVLVKFVNPSTL